MTPEAAKIGLDKLPDAKEKIPRLKLSDWPDLREMKFSNEKAFITGINGQDGSYLSNIYLN